MNAPPHDAIVVAGCPPRADGRPSPALYRRVRLGVDLWQQGRAPILVFSGGGAPVTEAEAAARMAQEAGVPPHAIRCEPEATSTEENALYTSRILGPVRIVVVTDAWHAWRCQRVFQRHFPAVEAVGVPVSWRNWLLMAPREISVITWYAMTGRLTR